MLIDRALKRRDAAKIRFRDLCSQTVFYGFSHEQHLAKRNEILADLKTAPRWTRDYLSGYAQREFDRWFESELVWCHVAPDGQFYSAHVNAKPELVQFASPVDPLYKAGRGAEIALWDHGHFWIAASNREMQYGRAPKQF